MERHESPSASPGAGDEFFRRMVEASTDAVVTADADGTILYANDAFESLLGYDPETIRGKQLGEFVPDHLRERYEGWHARYAAGAEGTPFDGDTFEVTWLTADGEEKRLSASAFQHDGGGRRLFTGILREAPEETESVERLREERALVEELFETSPVALSVRDADGELLRANERATELTGQLSVELPSDENVRDLLDGWDVYDADGEPLSWGNLPTGRVYETGEPVYNEEVILEPPEGERVYLSVSAAPTYEDGEIHRVVSTAEDISELKRTQHELERRHEELQSELAEIFDRITDGFFGLDTDWQFTYVNDAAEEMLLRSKHDLVGRNVWEEFPEAVDSTFEREYRRAMEHQKPVSFQEYYPPLETWFEVQAYPSETGLSVYFRDITERKQREQQLERYETIIETVDDGVYALDSDERFVMANQAFCEMTGYDREELLGEHASVVHGEDVSETAGELSERAAAEGSGATLEFGLRTADGETIPAEARFGPYRDDDSRFARTGVVRDVSERKRFEQTLAALHESSRELLELETETEVAESVLQTVTDVLGIPGAGIYLWDEESSELAPAAYSEHVGDIFGDLPTFEPGDVSLTWRAFAERETITLDDVRETDQTYRDDTPLKSGVWIPLGDHGVLAVVSEEVGAFGPEEKELSDLLAASAEATLDRVERERERREHERQLEESEQRYRTLIEHFPNGGVSLFDRDLRYVVVGGQIFDDLGVDTDEVEGRPVGERLPQDVRDAIRPKYRAVFDGEASSFELEYAGRVIQGRVLPVRDAEGDIMAGMVMTQDITERKEHERELEEQNERLDAFASMLAHELRNPLEIAQIYLDMAVENAGEASDDRAFDEVDQALDRIEEMIDSLLVVTRHGDAVETRDDVDLGDAAERWWGAVEDRDGALSVETDRTIRADAARLRQLMENLYRNAEEHAGPDVAVRVGELDDGTGFYVEDDGPGISAETREQAFEPGYSTSSVGIGFGLAVVRHLAEAHGWEYDVTDAASGGARFEFRGVEFADES